MTSDSLQKLGNKYTLLDLLGVGGMAEVFKGKLSGAEGFEKLVVIKKLFPQFARDPEIVSHFIAEAKLAALLQHENIAQTYDFGELDGSYFIAMEYLIGKDLHTVIQRAKELNLPLGIAQALFITAKILEGMEYAHALKDQHLQPLHLIHRDLSPQNVFITSEGRVKIIDFGIARADLFDNKTKVGVAKGKISYMSPEQLTAEKVDHRSDIFAIGILLYEMLSGKRMYSGDTATLIRKCMGVEYERLDAVRPGLPPPLYAILDKALAKDVSERYQGCALMLFDIEEVLFSIESRPSAHLLEGYMRRLFEGQPVTGMKSPAAGETTGARDLHGNSEEPVEATVLLQTRAQPPPPSRPGSVKLLATAGVCTLFAVIFFMWLHFRTDRGQGVPAPPQVSVESAIQAKETPPAEVPPPTSTPVLSQLPPEQQEPPQDEINRLLEQAEEVLGKKQPTTSDLETALSLYHRVQETQPDHWEARAGIARIGEYQRNETEEAMKGGNFPQTQKNAAKGLFNAPKDNRFLSLQGVVGEQQQKMIQSLAVKAEQAMERNDLTTPEEDNAYKFYHEILELEPQNTVAMLGFAKISEKYADMAENAFREMRLPSTRTYVRQGLTVNPQNKRLLELQQDLLRSKPEIFIKSIEKSFNDNTPARADDETLPKKESAK